MVARSEETLSVHSSGSPVATQLQRIAEKARKAPGFQFTSLYHLMNEELLRGCFQRLRKDAAAGIDEMTKAEYAENLESNLVDLVGRLHRMAYIPQAVRRNTFPSLAAPSCVLWGFHVLKTSWSKLVLCAFLNQSMRMIL